MSVVHITDGRGNRNITKMEQAWNILYPEADDDEDRFFFKDTDTFLVSSARNCRN